MFSALDPQLQLHDYSKKDACNTILQTIFPASHHIAQSLASLSMSVLCGLLGHLLTKQELGWNFGFLEMVDASSNSTRPNTQLQAGFPHLYPDVVVFLGLGQCFTSLSCVASLKKVGNHYII